MHGQSAYTFRGRRRTIEEVLTAHEPIPPQPYPAGGLGDGESLLRFEVDDGFSTDNGHGVIVTHCDGAGRIFAMNVHHPPAGSPQPPESAQPSHAWEPAGPRPVSYDQFYKTPAYRWWRSLLSVLAVNGGVYAFSFAFSFLGIAVAAATGQIDLNELQHGTIPMTPMIFLFGVNLPLIAAGIVAMLVDRFMHRQRFGSLTSVTGRCRWSWVGRVCILLVPLFALYAALPLVAAGEGLQLDATAAAFIVIVLLTTPVQSAAEEYIFRGVVQRSVSSWITDRRAAFVVGALVSALLFMVAHAATDIWLLGYYLIFGLSLSCLTRATGGLEAAISIHALNNVGLLIASALSGELSAGFDRSAGVGGPFMLVPMFAIIGLSAALGLWARRRKLVVTGTPVLRPGSVAEPASPAYR